MSLSDRLHMRADFLQRRRDARFRAAVFYAEARKRGLGLAEKTVLLETSNPTEIPDSLHATFTAMLDDPEYAGFTFVWALKGDNDFRQQQYSSHPRVRIVGYLTQEHADALWESKFLVTDKAWPSHVTKRPGQVCILAWHGTTSEEPLGTEAGKEADALKSVARSLLQTDYLVVPDHSTGERLLRASGIGELFPGTVLEAELPRLGSDTMLGPPPKSVSPVRFAGPVHPRNEGAKTRIVIVGSTFEGGPATFEAIGFSRAIDHDRYDLTVLLPGKATPEREHHLRMLHPDTRVLFTFGYRALTFSEFRQRALWRELTPSQRCAPETVAEALPFYERERRRLLGDVRFDVGLCFTDKLTEATLLLALGDFGRRVMCLTEPGEEVMRRLDAPLIAEHFERVLVTPKAEGHPTVEAIRKIERERGVSEKHSKLVPVGRFAGYGNSVEAFRSEIHDQLTGRLRSKLPRQAHAAGSQIDPAADERIQAAVEPAIGRLVELLLAHTTDVHERHGLDWQAHNGRVLETYERAIASDAGSRTIDSA